MLLAFLTPRQKHMCFFVHVRASMLLRETNVETSVKAESAEGADSLGPPSFRQLDGKIVPSASQLTGTFTHAKKTVKKHFHQCKAPLRMHLYVSIYTLADRRKPWSGLPQKQRQGRTVGTHVCGQRQHTGKQEKNNKKHATPTKATLTGFPLVRQ